jgi:hypothetical protein
MIPHLEISVDTLEAEKYLNDAEKSQIPFALALTLNDTMNDAQRAVRGAAYDRVFTRRNKQLSRALTTIPNQYRATKNRLEVQMMNVRDNRTGRMAGEGFINRQVDGRVKRPRGSVIAVPQIGAGMRRLAGGSVPAAKKPRAMGDKLIRIKGGLYEKQRGDKLVKRYALTKSAKPNRKGRFRYYETATKVALRVAPGHWARRFSRALATARR